MRTVNIHEAKMYFFKIRTTTPINSGQNLKGLLRSRRTYQLAFIFPVIHAKFP